MKRLNFMLLVITLLCLFTFEVTEKPKVETKEKCEPVEEKVLKTPLEEEGISYGQASYYGEYWNGRTTANMEIYDCDLLTCASPSLPFNTVIKVTNLDNCKTVTIRVNDRGPYKMDKHGKVLKPLVPHPKRVLDLSKASFKYIANLKTGVLNIKYEIIT